MPKVPEPPPMRHIVKGWWLHKEFDTFQEAENFLREWKVKATQAFFVGLIFLQVIAIISILVRIRCS